MICMWEGIQNFIASEINYATGNLQIYSTLYTDDCQDMYHIQSSWKVKKMCVRKEQIVTISKAIKVFKDCDSVRFNTLCI